MKHIYCNRIKRNEQNLWLLYNPVQFINDKIDIVCNLDEFIEKQGLNPRDFYEQYICFNGNIVIYSELSKIKQMQSKILRNPKLIHNINFIDELKLVYFYAENMSDAYSRIKKMKIISKKIFISECEKIFSEQNEFLIKTFEYTGNKFSFDSCDGGFVLGIKLKNYDIYRGELQDKEMN